MPPRTTFFLGPLSRAPAIARRKVGTLIPVHQEATVTVLFVPAKQRRTDECIELNSAQTHLLILLEKEARATITLRHSGSNACTHATEIVLEEGAHCHITTLQQCKAHATLNLTEEAWLGKETTLNRTVRALDSGHSNHRLRSHITGKTSHSDVHWTGLTSGTQRRSIRAEQVFQASGGSGEILLKGIAQENGMLDCHGHITIEEGGVGTRATLMEHMLILHASAVIHAVPALTIRTHDVQVSHAASIRRITAEDVFSLNARGIGADAARDMLIRGFLGMAQTETDAIE